jgi:glycosyltransferase involved in cell wall biosynthesis
VKLRVALFCESGEPGGAERMMLQLAEQLRERGHEILPLGPEDGDPWLATQYRAAGFDPATYSLRSAADPLCLAQVMRTLRRHRIDVVHSHDYFAAVYGAAAAWLLRKPHVITMHGTRYYTERPHRRVALKWGATHSRALVGVSAATADELATTLRLPRSAVRVIYNGVTARAGNGEAVRRELQLREEERLVVAVGSLFPVKGHVVLLRALRRLANDDGVPPWRAAVAGIGGEEGALRTFIAEHGLTDRVHLLGLRSDVPDLLAAADVYAMPSLSEGSPLALMEAMFAGTAIVASRTGGIPELVSDDDDALLTPPGDDAALAAALGRLLSDADLRVRLGAAARRRAQSRFTNERMTDEYERLYVGD